MARRIQPEICQDRRIQIMEIKCPHCGSEDFETFDRVGDGTCAPTDLCVCDECETQFRIIYKIDRIEKESP
jgi:formate dehydrogenase maturation protein FdhE